MSKEQKSEFKETGFSVEGGDWFNSGIEGQLNAVSVI